MESSYEEWETETVDTERRESDAYYSTFSPFDLINESGEQRSALLPSREVASSATHFRGSKATTFTKEHSVTPPLSVGRRSSDVEILFVEEETVPTPSSAYSRPLQGQHTRKWSTSGGDADHHGSGVGKHAVASKPPHILPRHPSAPASSSAAVYGSPVVQEPMSKIARAPPSSCALFERYQSRAVSLKRNSSQPPRGSAPRIVTEDHGADLPPPHFASQCLCSGDLLRNRDASYEMNHQRLRLRTLPSSRCSREKVHSPRAKGQPSSAPLNEDEGGRGNIATHCREIRYRRLHRLGCSGILNGCSKTFPEKNGWDAFQTSAMSVEGGPNDLYDTSLSLPTASIPQTAPVAETPRVELQARESITSEGFSDLHPSISTSRRAKSIAMLLRALSVNIDRAPSNRDVLQFQVPPTPKTVGHGEQEKVHVENLKQEQYGDRCKEALQGQNQKLMEQSRQLEQHHHERVKHQCPTEQKPQNPNQDVGQEKLWLERRQLLQLHWDPTPITAPKPLDNGFCFNQQCSSLYHEPHHFSFSSLAAQPSQRIYNVSST